MAASTHQKVKLTESQKKIAKSRARFKAVRAGRRNGKTFYILHEIRTRLVLGEVKLAYIAPTREHAIQIAWDELHALLEGLIVTQDQGKGVIGVKNSMGTVSTISFYGWNMKGYEKLRGKSFHHVYLDEVALYTDFFYGWKSAARATLADYRGGAMFVSTPKGFNHFYVLCTRGLSDEPTNDGKKNFKSFHFTSFDNENVPREEIEELARELGDDMYSQEILAEFTKQQGLVYQEFSRGRHILTEMPEWAKAPHVRKYVGVDWGFRDPTAMPVVLTDGKRYLVVDEFYEVGKTHKEVSDMAVSIRGVDEYFIEPAEPALALEIGRQGVRVAHSKEIDKTITTGVSKIKDAIRADCFFVMDSCVNTIIEFDMYSIDDKTGEPKDENNHIMDALRYIILTVENRKQPMTQNTNQNAKVTFQKKQRKL